MKENETVEGRARRCATMKPLIFTLARFLGAAFLVLLAFTACTTREERQLSALLDRADSLMRTRPDSSLYILNKVRTPSTTSLSMRHALLHVKADDKLYRPITGYESLVTDTLLPYFRHHDSEWLPTALFYAGRICADKGDAPQAIDYYQQALDAMPEQGNDPDFCGLIYSQIGTLFYYQNLYEEAIVQYKLAYTCQQQGNNTNGMIFDLRDIGNSFLLLESPDSALAYFKRAASLADSTNNRNMYIDVMGEIANLYLDQGNYIEAKKHIQPGIACLDSANISSTYFIISNIFYQTGQLDSAEYYFKKLLQYGNLYGKQSAFLHLSEMAYQKMQYKEFRELTDSLRLYDDSIKYLNNAEIISRMHSLYNYHRYQASAMQMEQENSRLVIWLLSLALLLVLLATLVFFLLGYIRKRQAAVRQMKEKSARMTKGLQEVKRELELLHLMKSQLADSNSGLNDEILHLNEMIGHKEKEKNVLLGKVSSLQSKLEPSNLLAEKIEAPIVATFWKYATQVKEKPSEEEWRELCDLVDKTVPNFHAILSNNGELPSHHYRLCCLVRLGFDNTDIKVLISENLSNITMTYKNLHRKILQAPGSAKDFKNFIRRIGQEQLS